MAYMNQEKKKELAPQIKAVLKKYGMKASIAVRHHSSLVVNIKSGKLDIIGNYAKTNADKPSFDGNPRDFSDLTYIDVNTYWIHDSYSGVVRQFLEELKDAMNGKGSDIENFDHSDIQSDYFHVGWYIDINVGQWDKPYEVTA